jgi:hypothetical protein
MAKEVAHRYAIDTVALLEALRREVDLGRNYHSRWQIWTGSSAERE